MVHVKRRFIDRINTPGVVRVWKKLDRSKGDFKLHGFVFRVFRHEILKVYCMAPSGSFGGYRFQEATQRVNSYTSRT